MASVDFLEIKAAIPLSWALAALGWRGHSCWGDNRRGPCLVNGCTNRKRQPMWACNDKWYCHKCRIGGDVLDLWSRVHGLPLMAACYDLCGAFGMEVPYIPRRARRPRPSRNGEEDR